MRWSALLSIAAVFSTQAHAIFADDAFQLDYHHALLGRPLTHATFFHQPQSSSNASLIYTISDKAVLGAVHPKDGSVLWRQVLAGRPVAYTTKAFLVAAEDGIVVSGYEADVSAWDALNGKLIWTHHLSQNKVVVDLQAIVSPEGAPQDFAVLAAGDAGQTTIDRFAGEGRDSVWQHVDKSGDEPLGIATTKDAVYYVSKSTTILSGAKTNVAVVDINSGKLIKQYSPAAGSVPLGVGGKYVVGLGSQYPFLVTTDSPYTSIKVNLLGTTKSTTLTLDDKNEEIEGLIAHLPRGAAKPHLLVHAQGRSRQWAEIFHVDPASGDATKAYSLPATQEASIFAASNVGDTVYFTRATETEISLWSSESHGQLGRWPRRGVAGRASEFVGQDGHAVSEVVARGKSNLAVRVAEASSGGRWNLIRNGETQWTRLEVLANAVLAAWADEIDHGGLVADLEVEVSSNPLTAYVHRLNRHAQALRELPAYIRHRIERLFQDSSDAAIPSLKSMVGDKTVVIATSRQELLALDAVNGGSLKWQINISKSPNTNIPVTSISIRENRITAYLQDGSFLVVNLRDGSIIEQKDGNTPMIKILEVQGKPESTLVKVDLNGIPRLALDYSSSTAIEGNALITISNTGKALGWTIGQTIEKTWTISPPSAEIINAVARPAHDPVASIGTVLGNRSVLYKYLSPNLALLTAISKSSDTLSMYLVDSVTGTVLHTSTHVNVDTKSIIPSVMSENWFAYSFSAKDPESLAISTYLVVAELFESSAPNDRGPLGQITNYSSFAPGSSTKPHVLSQAFTITEPISHMAVSQTGQGITVRQLLCTLPDSGAIIGIPRHLLDPRRTVDRDPTGMELEEGLSRYSPVLNLDTKLFLTHSREVIGIKKLMSSPTLLESTSLIFGFGHDVFGTRISPSMAYDVLGKGFGKVSLILTVVALWIGVMVLAPMARSRQVEGRWKG